MLEHSFDIFIGVKFVKLLLQFDAWEFDIYVI